MKTFKRGSTLVAALLVSVLLLVAGMGFLGQRAAQNRAANGAILHAQARALAEAGLEDAVQKLGKDSQFPPLRAESQTVFTYAEGFSDIHGDPLGQYVVSIDVTHRQTPYFIVKLTSSGHLGSPVQATAQLVAELDVAAQIRGTGNANPNFFRLLYVQGGQPF